MNTDQHKTLTLLKTWVLWFLFDWMATKRKLGKWQNSAQHQKTGTPDTLSYSTVKVFVLIWFSWAIQSFPFDLLPCVFFFHLFLWTFSRIHVGLFLGLSITMLPWLLYMCVRKSTNMFSFFCKVSWLCRIFTFLYKCSQEYLLYHYE